MDNIKAVLFDFDDTMVDFIKSDIDALKTLIEVLPYEIDVNKFIDVSVKKIDEFHNLFIEGKEEEINSTAYRLRNTMKYFSIEWEERYLKIYLENFIESTTCFEGVEEVLNYLHNKVKLGILTNAYNSEIQKIRINKSGIVDYFDDVVVCSDIKIYKPSKEAFLYLLKKYNIEPSSCIYVGDSEKYDIEGAKNAGLYTIKMLNNKKLKSISKADYVCKDFKEIYKVLQELGT